MSGYLPLSFIQEKISELEQALLFSLTDDVLKLPTCVVNVLSVDELGQLWFVIPKPAQALHAFERVFPVKLDFFRKGRDFFLKVQGKAFIVTDPEELNNIEVLSNDIKQKAWRNQAMILKVCITHADFTEKSPVRPSARQVLQQMKMMIHHLFLQSRQDGKAVFNRIPANNMMHSSTYFN